MSSPAPRSRAASAAHALALAAIAGQLALGATTALARWSWLGDVAASFRWQCGWCGVAIAAGLLALRRPRLAALSAGIALATLAPALGLARPPAPAEGAGPDVVVASANLLYRNREPEAFAAWVARERPDVLCVQEVGAPRPAVLEGLAGDYPHRRIVAGGDPAVVGAAFGIGILSRHPIEEARTVELFPGALPMVEVLVSVGGRRALVRTVHLLHPTDRARWRTRNAMLARLAELPWPEGAVLAGDLNASSGSPHFAALLARSGLRDSCSGFGRQPTWETVRPIAGLATDLDHVLVAGGVEVLGRRTSEVPGSDHRAVVVRLRLVAR